ncbi:hypothetical protein MMC29_000951 [Sticta canariensis]|nr:hypothetical protein [Sticta canariensis]
MLPFIPGSKRTAYICVFLKALVTLSSAILVTPRLRLLESNVCRSHYQTFNSTAIDYFTNNVAEELCKIEPVQVDLAYLLGWNFFFQNVPTLIIGFAYSILSERIDRKVLLLITVSSNTLAQLYFYSICFFYDTFALRLIWATSLFDLIGGGKIVFDSLTLAIIAETVPASSLSTTLYYLTAFLTAIRMIGVSGGSYLIGTGIWLPIALGCTILTGTIPTALLLPGGKYTPISHSEEDDDSECQPEDCAIPIQALKAPDPSSSVPASPTSIPNTFLPQLRSTSTLQAYFHLLRTSISSLTPYILPLCIFLIHELAMGIRDIAEQWMSTRYTVPLQKIGYILAGQTLFSAAILGLLPTMGSKVSKATSTAGRDKDFLILKASIVLSASGAVLIALAPSIPFLLCGLAVFASAVGFHDALIAVVTRGLSNPNSGSSGISNGDTSVARLYMTISIIEVAGNMANGPLWAAVYRLALTTGTKIGMATPFLVSGMIFAGVGALVWGLSSRRSDRAGF